VHYHKNDQGLLKLPFGKLRRPYHENELNIIVRSLVIAIPGPKAENFSINHLI